jgi:dienelactone hydrolase
LATEGRAGRRACAGRLARWSVLVCCAWLSAATCLASNGSGGRAWTPEDSIGIRYFVPNPSVQDAPGWIRARSASDRPVVYSPKRDYFFYVFFSGDLSTDEIVGEMHVHAVKDVASAITERESSGDAARPPSPLRLVTFRSSSSEVWKAPIFQPKWESDDAILFLGASGKTQSLFRLNVSSGQLTRLTDPKSDVWYWYGLPAPGSTSLLFMSFRDVSWTPLEQYPAAVIAGNELSQLLNPVRTVRDVYTVHKGGTPIRAFTLDRGAIMGPWISPDERWAVVACPPEGPVPERWLGYEVPPKTGIRFVLVNMETGAVREMMDAPIGTVMHAGENLRKPTHAWWSADSKRVVLFNTALPLDPRFGERRSTSYVVDFDVANWIWKPLVPIADRNSGKIVDSEWIEEGKSLRLIGDDARRKHMPDVSFAYINGQWVKQKRTSPPPAPSPVSAPLNDLLRVTLEEGPNDPPRIVAELEGSKLTLTSPDPALEGLARADVRTVEWKEADGKTEQGLLMLPPKKDGDRLPPLVVQGNVSLREFRPDGATFGAFAAQSLVARGIAVLQINIAANSSTALSPREGPFFVQRLDAAVEELVRQGLIDRSKVGLAGFSRSGYATYYIVTHPGRTPVSAAVVFDGITTSYGEYVIQAGLGDAEGTAHYGKQYGNGTFWDNKQGWLDAPAFNVERVRAPVLFATANRKVAAFAALETIGAFRHARRPFEYLMFSDGSHALQRPLERLFATTQALDWMSYWLLGIEPKDDATGRVQRWRMLKDMQPARPQ